MGNANSYQRKYWYSRVAEYQAGEYCKGCGISKDSEWLEHPFTGLRLDKINNDGNHTVTDNIVSDFQLLCISCNLIKNHPRNVPTDEITLQETASERKNRKAEKPLFEWLFDLIQQGKTVTWKYFVAEGSFKFDISPYSIETRYYKKYFLAPSAPFELYQDDLKGDMIQFKESFLLKQRDKVNLDIVSSTPTPLKGDWIKTIRNIFTRK